MSFWVILLLRDIQAFPENMLNSIFLAMLLNLINSGLAFFLFEYSLGKSNKIFLIANLGGMGIRIILQLILILISLKFLKIDIFNFIFIFFIIYFLSLTIEILYISKNVQYLKDSSKG